MKHHPAGPSRLGRLAMCPGSYALTMEAERRGMVIETHADDAAEGTLLHSLLPAGKSLTGVADDLADLVLRTRDWIASYTKGSEVFYEQRLELWHDGELLLFGTADVVAARQGKPHFIGEIKMGRTEVEREMLSYQGLAYGCAYGQSRRPLLGVEVCAFQPRLGLEFKESFSPAALEEGTMAIKRIIDMAALSSAARMPRPEACRLCPAKSICPEFQGGLELVPKKEFLPDDVGALEKLCQLCTMVESIGPAARTKLREMIEAGAESSVYEVRSKTIRQPKDIETVYALLDGILSQEELLACAELKVTKLEKALKAKGGGIAGCVVESQTKYLQKRRSVE